MDNIIQLIVFFFIIYSILAPFFGKKKQQKNNKQVPKNYSGDVRKTRTSPQPSSQDILEDFLGFKIPKTGDEYENPKTVDYDTDLKVDYKNLETASSLPDIDYDNLPAYENQKTPMESSRSTTVHDSAIPYNDRTLMIKKMLREKNDLRNAFLLSEILYKPKALRR